MDVPIVKEMIISNIIAKEGLLRKINAALFVFRRDFNQLKFRDGFDKSLEELLDILDLQLNIKKKLESILEELEKDGTILGFDIEDMNLQTLDRILGNILQAENYGEYENRLSLRVDELLEAV